MSGSGSGPGQANTAMNQAAAQQQAARLPPSDADLDRFKTGAQEQLANAAMGTSSVKMLRDASGGQEDIPRKIKLAIRMQYYTAAQTFGLMLAAFAFTMGLNAIIYVYVYKAVKYDLFASDAGWDKGTFFALGFWIAAWFGAYESRGGYRCNPDNEEVKKQRKEGVACIDDYDCTKSQKLIYGACRHRARHGAVGFARQILWYGTPLAALICFVAMMTIGNERNATSEERFISASLGLSFGIFWMFFFA